MSLLTPSTDPSATDGAPRRRAGGGGEPASLEADRVSAWFGSHKVLEQASRSTWPADRSRP